MQRSKTPAVHTKLQFAGSKFKLKPRVTAARTESTVAGPSTGTLSSASNARMSAVSAISSLSREGLKASSKILPAPGRLRLQSAGGEVGTAKSNLTAAPRAPALRQAEDAHVHPLRQLRRDHPPGSRGINKNRGPLES